MKIALIGWGTVARSLALLAERLKETSGIEIKAVLIRPQHPADNPKMTANIEEILNDEEIRLVVEMIPGVHPAFEYCAAAMQAGKAVVTSNKAMVSACFLELTKLAEVCGVLFRYDACVAGGIPWLRTIQQLKSSDPITAICGIFNGTSNYVLDHMEREGLTLAEGVHRAQALGYAEKDPSADLSGEDLARKLMISCAAAFDMLPERQSLYCRGIESFTQEDCEAIQARGLRLRLCSEAYLEEGRLKAEVEPVILNRTSSLAAIHENLNCGILATDFLGKLSLSGQGAGGNPTAHAVMTDILAAAQELAVKAVNSDRQRTPAAGKKQVKRIKADQRTGAVRYFIAGSVWHPDLAALAVEQRQNRGRFLYWTHAEEAQRLRRLIEESRSLDPHLFAARLEEGL